MMFATLAGGVCAFAHTLLIPSPSFFIPPVSVEITIHRIIPLILRGKDLILAALAQTRNTVFLSAQSITETVHRVFTPNTGLGSGRSMAVNSNRLEERFDFRAFLGRFHACILSRYGARSSVKP